jgi:glycosyltransferase involved in cell wall biosynthesis
MISIVICSARPDRLAALRQNVEETIGTPYEIIAIDNTSNRYGICAAYNQGGARAQYPFICFMHEDISFATPNWGKRVIRHFSDTNTGMLGMAGGDAKSLVPSSWSSCMISNEINIFQYFHADRRPPEHHLVTGPPAPDIKKRVVALDGVWLCTRKEIFDQYKFDEVNFPGFHGYDIDYSLQLVQHYHLYVVFDILIHHYSEGKPDRTWMNSARRVSRKWRHMLPVSIYDAPDYHLHHWTSMQIFLEHLLRLRYNYPTLLLSWMTWSFTRYFSFRRFGSMGKYILTARSRDASQLINSPRENK